MELRAPPPTGGGNQKQNLIPIIVSVFACALLLAGLILWRTGGAGGGQFADGDGSGETPAKLRQLASKLKAAGALDEAAELYAAYLQRAALPDETRAKIAFSLGTLFVDAGQYERALRWFYDAESTAPEAVGPDLGKKIVHVLERMGRSHAAKTALAGQVGLAPQGQAVERAADDPVVAKVGAEEIHLSDLTRALDDLPPELGKRFSTPEGKQAYLRQYVADLLLARKAEKLEYDKRPEVRRRLESLRRQLVVSAFVEREIVGKVEITDADLATYFQANRSQYDQPPAAKLRMMKLADPDAAKNVVAELAAGKSFAALAKQHSLDTASRSRGGAIERWISKGEAFIPGGDAAAISEVIFGTAKGKVTPPVPAGSHTYLFEIQNTRAGKEVQLEDVRPRVERDYRAMKTRTAYMNMVEKELSSEDVELFADKLSQGN